MATLDILNDIKASSSIETKLQEKFGLKLNPFPKSGIANISEPDNVVSTLIPANQETIKSVISYMKDALSNSGANKEDKYISLVVRGEYGSGKTQLLMYMRCVLRMLDSDVFHPYVIYLDNPGLSVSELIGNVIAQIGVENFRRFLWDTFLSYLKCKENNSETTRQDSLINDINSKLPNDQRTLFAEDHVSWESSLLSYKILMDEVIKHTKRSQQKDIVEVIKGAMVQCFMDRFQHPQVAEYFYNIVSENINMLKSWGALVDGSVKNLDKKAVYILNAIVQIAKDYLHSTDFIILVDEFEEIATGRLKDSDLDNYLRNLRTLIDKERQWCSIFAMTGEAFKKIQQVSPPLSSRIGDRIIDLKPFNAEAFKHVVSNYLNLARDEKSDSVVPFTEEALEKMLDTRNTLLKGSPRFLLKYCYLLLQRAADDLDKGKTIDIDFVKKYMSDVLK